MPVTKLKPKRNLTTEQKVKELMQSHPLMGAFVVNALLEQADRVQADKVAWPDNSWISWSAWKACADEVQYTFGKKGE